VYRSCGAVLSPPRESPPCSQPLHLSLLRRTTPFLEKICRRSPSMSRSRATYATRPPFATSIGTSIHLQPHTLRPRTTLNNQKHCVMRCVPFVGQFTPQPPEPPISNHPAHPPPPPPGTDPTHLHSHDLHHTSPSPPLAAPLLSERLHLNAPPLADPPPRAPDSEPVRTYLSTHRTSPRTGRLNAPSIAPPLGSPHPEDPTRNQSPVLGFVCG
jgi:hypothetical protein